MSIEDQSYKAMGEGILRARLIRRDLSNTLTEYEPEKVRGLNRAYIKTVKEIIAQGERYLDHCSNLELGVKISTIIENYRALLFSLPKQDETD